jgi:hypothetical protein
VKCQALARVLIDHRQHAYPTTVRKPLSNEIHTPLLVPAQGLALRQALPLCSFLALPCSHDQSLLNIQAVNPFGVHFPTLALQQDSQASVAVAYSAAGQLPQTHPQCLMAFPVMFVTKSHSWNRNQPRSMTLAQLVDLLGPLGKLAPRTRLHNFFATISCRI